MENAQGFYTTTLIRRPAAYLLRITLYSGEVLDVEEKS